LKIAANIGKVIAKLVRTMKITHLVTTAAVAAALALATPAFAQRRGGTSARPPSAGREAGRAEPRSAAPAPAQRVEPRSAAPSRSFESRPSQSRGFESRPSQSRSFESRSFESRSFAQRSAPRITGRYVPSSRSYVRVAPRVIPRYSSAYRYRVYTPYYTFRPRYSIGFGLYVGYPVVYPSWAYPYAYDPYSYGYDYATPYPAYPPTYAPGYSTPGYTEPRYSNAPNSVPVPGSVEAQRGAAAGGVSFEITPSDAEIFIDGRSYGPASDFTPTSAPLSLSAGRHHVEIRANGYETMTFDTDIVTGQVIPYQGSMQSLR
jgi:hypothetical protein